MPRCPACPFLSDLPTLTLQFLLKLTSLLPCLFFPIHLPTSIPQYISHESCWHSHSNHSATWLCWDSRYPGWEWLSYNHLTNCMAVAVVLITVHLLLPVSLWLLRDFRCIQSTEVYWGGGCSLYMFYMWLYTTISRMYLSIEYKTLLIRSYCTYL